MYPRHKWSLKKVIVDGSAKTFVYEDLGIMKTVIDLNSPEGNAYNLLGIASNLAKQLNLNSEEILSDMQSSDYEHLIEVFNSNFGDYYQLKNNVRNTKTNR